MSGSFRATLLMYVLTACLPAQGADLATLSDRFSGMRWFESTGWAGESLTWVRMENGEAAEQFVYELKGSSLQVQWSTAKNGAMKVGDTIACTRA
jgi:hypothetical protein